MIKVINERSLKDRKIIAYSWDDDYYGLIPKVTRESEFSCPFYPDTYETEVTLRDAVDTFTVPVYRYSDPRGEDGYRYEILLPY